MDPGHAHPLIADLDLPYLQYEYKLPNYFVGSDTNATTSGGQSHSQFEWQDMMHLHYAQISESSRGLKPRATNRKRVISPLNHLGSSRELWNLEFI
jgi:hypothetical protein